MSSLVDGTTENLSEVDHTKHFFRVRDGIERGWLVKTFDWPSFLEVGSESIILRTLSRRQAEIRSLMLALPSLLISFLVSVTIWNRIQSYLLTELGHSSWAAIMVLVLTLIGWIVTNLFVLLGIVYLLDFLTFPLQARLSIPTAIVTPIDLKIGGLRHAVRLQVD